MGDILDLEKAREERAPHLSGEARCLACGYEWVAVARVGTIWMECPSCHLERGRYVGPADREGFHLHCDCDCDLFYITPKGAYCPNCGLDQILPARTF